TSAGELSFYTLHLKSRIARTAADPQSAQQRLAEATAIHTIIRDTADATPDALVLVGGDFNDSPTSTTLRRFTSGKPVPSLAMLPARDSHGETWTYRNVRDDYYSRSDYFLHSPALARHICGAAHIADLPAADTASDHRLVFVDLDFGNAPKE
ncbi:MAG: endonuclease/exonuclease/phosphatase family protein, partial [Puniceicoccales bacterium]|nr:endonuclease/exonuclease/phosphatase family protein [Puniceicoccales bacterium]